MAKALYRQYRPKTFDKVLGQDRVVNVLKNQVKLNKISHAYLFAGERGTGKTSCAKIFAKAINCLNPVDGSPCGKCENCLAIEEETTIDVVEMDAASNRRIDDIRNLKDNVIYPPNKLKYKVYIIDEAHMITREAFNALLKIMEEPPSHLVFILATTEIEKIPQTILSRLQRFEFNKIGRKEIYQQISKILKDKNISMNDDAINLIIKKSNGAMRDALSLLDQVLSLELDNYSLKDVESLIGVVDFYEIDKLTEAIIKKDSFKSLDTLFSIRDKNKTNREIISSLIAYFDDILIHKMTNNDSFFKDEERLSYIKKRSEDINDLEVSDYLDLLIDYENKLKFADNTDVLTEVCLLRLVKLKNMENFESRIRAIEVNSSNDIEEIVNNLIDQKLKNYNFSKPLIDNPNVKVSNTNSPKSSNEVDKTNESEEKIEFSKQIFDRLDPKKEKEIQKMIINTAGGFLTTLFNNEGFNYKIKENEFIMLCNDDYYKIFIETKIDDIEKNLMSILGRAYKFSLDRIENLDNNNTIEESKENNDYSQKLKEVFGDDLIIE
ncbi:DNA polymerase III subunit gamma/tau [Anaerococcus sp. Marseille-P3625]|uniref:DNA polymerase III subunit gamma/tau n=1 Tax=Anaerococcus sp. Marseille-P3625 TaxID=1977277 RepID=UPI000C08B034|nr:DNA polymerase III subunit gamma/tau [Anaerococcus sp. Marseille-P3625]